MRRTTPVLAGLLCVGALASLAQGGMMRITEVLPSAKPVADGVVPVYFELTATAPDGPFDVVVLDAGSHQRDRITHVQTVEPNLESLYVFHDGAWPADFSPPPPVLHPLDDLRLNNATTLFAYDHVTGLEPGQRWSDVGAAASNWVAGLSVVLDDATADPDRLADVVAHLASDEALLRPIGDEDQLLTGPIDEQLSFSGSDHKLNPGKLGPTALDLAMVPEPGTAGLAAVALASLTLVRGRSRNGPTAARPYPSPAGRRARRPAAR